MMDLRNAIIFGLDLSFNSTGICMMYFDDEGQNTKISFDRVVFDKHPREVENISTTVYSLPTNLSVSELLIDAKELGKNENDQALITIKSLICAKAIKSVIKKYIQLLKPQQCLFVIENYIMPAFGGKNSLQNVSGLIAIQNYIREYVIGLKLQHGRDQEGTSTANAQTCVDTTLDTFLCTPTPTQVKKFFTGNGKAQKQEMEDVFLSKYDGNALIDIRERKGKFDDIVDAFALGCYGLSKIRK